MKWYVVCEGKLEEKLAEMQELCSQHGITQPVERLPSVCAFLLQYEGTKKELQEQLRSLPYVRAIYPASDAQAKGSKGL